MTQPLEGNLEDWKRAGRIGSQALRLGLKMIKPGAKMLDVINAVEKYIFDLGADLIFPAQISFNEFAAHDCAHYNDERVFKQGDLIKLDCGAMVDGHVSDNAGTVNLGDYDDLVKASRDAVDEAIKLATPGRNTAEIGKKINEVINSYGYNPVRNLTGHGIGVFKYHAPPAVPNFDPGRGHILQEGQTIAIEPFATNGQGMIASFGPPQVFAQKHKKPTRNLIARDLLQMIGKRNMMPFCIRHYVNDKMPLTRVEYAIKNLERENIIESYPPLKEISNGFVSQAEQSLMVSDKPVVFTKWDEE